MARCGCLETRPAIREISAAYHHDHPAESSEIFTCSIKQLIQLITQMAPVVAGLYGAKIPMHLLDKYLPGSASIAPLLSGLLGFNLLDYIWNTFVLSIFNFFTCSISIPAEDALHDDVLLWLTANVIDKPGWVTDGARRLMAGKARARDHTLMAQLAESDQSHMETPLATRQLTCE